jgi:ABC-type multidrug transport system ATPase subunit
MKLEVDSVNLKFGEHTVLSDVYCSFEVGKIHGILGRNGCGKSTLFKIIFGTLSSQYATVRIDKKYQKTLYETNLMKYLPQNFVIPEGISINKAIDLLGSDLKKCKALFDDKKIDLDSKIGNLSGGQRRFIEIIIFLNTESPFIILDEPFTHLMPIQIEEMKGIFMEYKTNKCLIISDHQYRHIIDVSDEICLIKNAKTHHLKQGNYLEQLRDLMYIL